MDGPSPWPGVYPLNLQGVINTPGVLQVVPITTPQTVNTAWNGSIIALGGNAYYNLTYAATSNYQTPFTSYLYNTDTVRYKGIVVPGFANFNLPPLSWATIFQSGGTWYGFHPKRNILSGNITFNVDPINGSDAAVGSPGATDGQSTGAAAFRTIQHAVDTIHSQVDCAGFSPTVQCADGTYSAGATLLDRVMGNVEILLRGNLTTPANCVVSVGNGETCFFAKDDGVFDLDGFTIQGGTGATGIHSGQFGICDVGANMRFGAMAAGTHLQVGQTGSMNILGNYSIVGNAASHISVEHNGGIDMTGGTAVKIPSALAFTTFIQGVFSADIKAGGVGYTGAGVAGTTGQRWALSGGSAMQTNGVDPDTIFPGNANGVQTLAGSDAVVDVLPKGLGTLATNASKGFVAIPYTAGTPTGTPTVYNGETPLILDVSGGKLWAYYGGVWHFAALT